MSPHIGSRIAIIAVIVCGSSVLVAKPMFSIDTMRTYAFVSLQALIEQSDEGKRAKEALKKRKAALQAELDRKAHETNDRAEANRLWGRLQADLAQEEKTAVQSVLAIVTARAIEDAKRRHVDVLFARERLLYARGTPTAALTTAVRIAVVDPLRALATCKEGQRAQAALNAATSRKQRELNPLSTTAKTNQLQEQLDEEGRRTSADIAARLNAELEELAKARGFDVVRNARAPKPGEKESDVIYLAPGVRIESEELTTALVAKHDRRWP